MVNNTIENLIKEWLNAKHLNKGTDSNWGITNTRAGYSEKVQGFFKPVYRSVSQNKMPKHRGKAWGALHNTAEPLVLEISKTD